MRTIAILFFLFVHTQNFAQVKDLSKETTAKYILANIYETNKLSFETIYKDAFYLRIYTMNDSKATPENYSEGDEVLSSIIISVSPDGDYYTNGKLYKIEGLTLPKITAIKETKHPEFTITIEHGKQSDRKTQTYTLKAK